MYYSCILKKKKMNKKRILIFTVSYFLCGLAFPPFGLGWMTFFLWVPIFYLTEKLTAKQAFVYHAILSLPYNALMYYWITNAFKFIPDSIAVVGWFFLLIFFCCVSGYVGSLFIWARRSRFFLILFPTLWAGFEVFRTQGDLSFPWFHLSYTLGDFISLIQIISWIGVFGLSFLIILCNLLVMEFYKNRKSKSGLKFLVGALFISFFLWIFGMITLATTPKNEVKKTSIHIVQPAIPQDFKWERPLFKSQMKEILNQMKKSPLKKGDLFVLPESVVSHFLKDVPSVFYDWLKWAKKNKVAIVFGSLDFKENDHPVKPFVYLNSAFFLDPEMVHIKQVFYEQYSKIRLVPFSEKLPFDNVLPFLNFINLGEGDFVEGDGPVIWNWNGVKYSPAICYEVVYPYFIRNIKNRGAQVLLNLTNDSWFGETAAPYQHLKITRFRSIELGLPIIRSVNAGISVYYDAWGRDIAQTQLLEKTVLTTQIEIRTKTTVYQKIGTVLEIFFLWFWIVFNLWFLICYFRKHKKK